MLFDLRFSDLDVFSQYYHCFIGYVCLCNNYDVGRNLSRFCPSIAILIIGGSMGTLGINVPP